MTIKSETKSPDCYSVLSILQQPCVHTRCWSSEKMSKVCQIFGVFLLLCMSLCLHFETAAGTETDDLHALLDFKSHIVEDPFHIMSSWNDSIHHCNWTGIACNISNGRVIYMNLTTQGLVGTVTPHIGNLTFLTLLNLSYNSFHGELPQEMGRLLYLQRLSIYNNYFSGSIPTNLSHCTQLAILDVGHNNLTGIIPTWIGNLSYLVAISFSENNLHGIIPHEVGRLYSLKLLWLDQNYFSGTIPSSTYNISSISAFVVTQNYLHGNIPADVGFTLPNLHLFLFGLNNFTGTIPASLLNATKLQMLDLGDNGLIGNVPKNIGLLNRLTFLSFGTNRLGSGRSHDLSFLDSLVNCTVLKDLYLYDNNFGGELPSSIANLSTQLYSLGLSVNKIHGSIPVGIGKLVNMTLLVLEDNQLSGSVPEALGMLQNLQELYLNKNKFSGRIPSSIGNLSSLTKLYMFQNYFEGTIPPSLGNCQKLLLLNISNNKLTGVIPKEVISISSLALYLDVSNNSLSGTLPTEVGKLVNLGELDLLENNFSGVIPSTMGSCTSMERLYLQGNYFEGNLPQTLQNLRGLQDIDISRNNLSGRVPEFLGDFRVLQHLNLSYNDLQGEMPKNGIFKNASIISIYGNKKLCGGIKELNLPACKVRKPSQLRKFLAPKVLVPGVSAFVFLLFLSCVFAIFMVKSARVKASSSKDLKFELSYFEIAKCTGGFSQDNLIGSGSFGSVYKGTLPSGEPTIAIKVLNLEQRGALRSFMDECQVLRNVRHRNLLKIITAISSIDHQGNDFKALVFKFMSNGSLESWLHPTNNMQYETKTLTFIQRLNIAIDVASALEYLHHSCETAIVHCDIKPSNVLLDNDMVAHVGDFGLATFLFEESSIMSSNLKGSLGYIPPEYGMGSNPSILGDVYSYGILLLEIFTGKRPTDEAFEGGMGIQQFIAMALPNHVMDIIDPSMLFEQELADENQVEGEENALRRVFDIEVETQYRGLMKDGIVSLMQIGVSCSATSPSERMHITEVVKNLHAIKKSVIRIHQNARVTRTTVR